MGNRSQGGDNFNQGRGRGGGGGRGRGAKPNSDSSSFVQEWDPVTAAAKREGAKKLDSAMVAGTEKMTSSKILERRKRFGVHKQDEAPKISGPQFTAEQLARRAQRGTATDANGAELLRGHASVRRVQLDGFLFFFSGYGFSLSLSLFIFFFFSGQQC